MSIGPITAGVSSIIGGLSATTMSVIASVSSFLATASIVTAIADILIVIGVNLYQAVEYAKEIGRHIPTSLEEDILIVIDQSFIGWIIPGDKGKELEVVIKAKEYLNYIKETGSKLLYDSPLIAVVRYAPNTREISSSVVHNKFTSCGGGVPVGVVPPCHDICETMKGDSNTVFDISNIKGDLSLVNISHFLSLTPEILNNTKVYLDRDGRHIPHITESEYIEGLRIVDAPKVFEHHQKTCKHNQECKIGEIKEVCEESFSFLGSPFILTNITRKEGKILYSSVPIEFKSI
ncbi:MAG: hypothetical protein KTV77_05535 [Wolbachia endosymbiont of Fragariocoptes setiger]|nr:hypothetical protein [Wolbachia endosymbiont of Fragariocoptes setiger]